MPPACFDILEIHAIGSANKFNALEAASLVFVENISDISITE